MIRTWIADISALYDVSCYKKHYNSLPSFRREKADCLKSQKNKAQSAGAWLLLEEIRRVYQIPDTSVYNLSHSGDYVLCAVDMDGKENMQIGCDIEQIRGEHMDLAKHFFCRSEYEELAECRTKQERMEKFYRYWVLKESFMKATRQGMRLPLSSFEIQLSDPPLLKQRPEQFSDSYYFCEYFLKEIPYRIAVCSNHPDIDSGIQMELKEIW